MLKNILLLALATASLESKAASRFNAPATPHKPSLSDKIKQVGSKVRSLQNGSTESRLQQTWNLQVDQVVDSGFLHTDVGSVMKSVLPIDFIQEDKLQDERFSFYQSAVDPNVIGKIMNTIYPLLSGSEDPRILIAGPVPEPLAYFLSKLLPRAMISVVAENPIDFKSGKGKQIDKKYKFVESENLIFFDHVPYSELQNETSSRKDRGLLDFFDQKSDSFIRMKYDMIVLTEILNFVPSCYDKYLTEDGSMICGVLSQGQGQPKYIMKRAKVEYDALGKFIEVFKL